jgi:gas vesicle protein
MSDNSGDVGNFLAGFVIGGLVGAAVALILAPQSGEETRAQIATKGHDLRVTGEQQYLDYRDKAGNAIKETSEMAQERARIVLDEGRSRLARDPLEETEIEEQEDEVGEAATGDAQA